ncbi:hypothetical protein GGX14DRAFT_587405 [Mycena pura]|uniref:Uncharacterized protein n=1 Tax=Mycena pura TaxID=153505 RepID=A0AAD6UWC0_9AGAR|nr:hypothetical protein GGX14DRAFT_587405 [Mycena pura]
MPSEPFDPLPPLLSEDEDDTLRWLGCKAIDNTSNDTTTSNDDHDDRKDDEPPRKKQKFSNNAWYLIVPNPIKNLLAAPAGGRGAKEKCGYGHEVLRLLLMGCPERECFLPPVFTPSSMIPARQSSSERSKTLPPSSFAYIHYTIYRILDRIVAPKYTCHKFRFHLSSTWTIASRRTTLVKASAEARCSPEFSVACGRPREQSPPGLARRPSRLTLIGYAICQTFVAMMPGDWKNVAGNKELYDDSPVWAKQTLEFLTTKVFEGSSGPEPETPLTKPTPTAALQTIISTKWQSSLTASVRSQTPVLVVLERPEPPPLEAMLASICARCVMRSRRCRPCWPHCWTGRRFARRCRGGNGGGACAARHVSRALAGGAAALVMALFCELEHRERQSEAAGPGPGPGTPPGSYGRQLLAGNWAYLCPETLEPTQKGSRDEIGPLCEGD